MLRKMMLIAVPSAILLGVPVGSLAQTTAPTPGNAATGVAQTRDEWQRQKDIFAALQAGPGSRIADLGAGEGWLTVRLARHVGPAGRVFASDISAAALDRLGQQVASDSLLRNVELILAEPDDPRLPYGSLDGVVIVNAYHEMTERVPVLEGIRRALKPGGLLVIVDNTPDDTLTSRASQTAQHKLALDLARDDLRAHGFELVREEPQFVEYWMTNHWMRQWLLVARRGVK